MKLSSAAAFCLCAAVLAAQDPTTRPATRPAAPDAASQDSFPWFGRVSATELNVRGGPSEAHSPVRKLGVGDVVKVVGRNGDWLKVEIPGGLPLWAAGRRGARDYIRQDEPGLGTVVARDLQLRGTPDTEEPSLGELESGAKVEIVGRRDDWVRLLMPTSHPGYVSSRFVKRAPEAEAAAAEFAERDARERDTLRQGSKELVDTLRRRAADEDRARAADAAFERFLAEKKKPALERDLKGVREALQQVVDAAPSEDDPRRIRAQGMLDDLKATEDVEAKLRHAKELQAEAERKAKAAQLTYEKDLEALRKRKEEEAAQRERRSKQYVAVGFVRLAPPIPGVLESAPKYALHRGSQREYYLVSDKYQLADFNGKHVGILEAEAPESRPGVDLRVLRVKKLEILAPGVE
ncbi:MAG TPA: SH3 domain-containing protein [Planctomycetota bacterium]|nr:SH3 domain-containing protein [Planctomycetota bacterium]